MRELIDEARAESGLHTEDKPPRNADLIRRLADALEQLQVENEWLRSEDGPYERTLEAVDTFAHAHFEAVGRPVPRWANFGEGALALEDELAWMRAENERLRQREADLVADVNLFGCAMLDLVRSGKLPAEAAARFAELVLKFEGDLETAHDREQENHRA